MSHLIIKDEVLGAIEARRYDMTRMWPDNLARAMEFQLISSPVGPVLPSESEAVMLIAQLTLAIERRVLK